MRRPEPLEIARLGLVIAAGCAPFSDLQSARIVPKGAVEVTPSYSAVTFTDDGETERTHDVIGVQAGVGVGGGGEMLAGEWRVAFARMEFDDGDGFNVLGTGPKFGIVRDHVAAYFPVGFAFGEDVEISETWETHPTVIFTIGPVGVLEINPSVKVLLPISSGADPRLAFNLGFGISHDFGIWALRPEIGVLTNPGGEGFFMAYSLGASFLPGN